MRKNNGRALLVLFCALLVLIGLSACGKDSRSEPISAEELDARHSELVAVQETHWPEEGEETATVVVSVPSMLAAYQSACQDPAYNDENALDMLYDRLEDSMTTIQISVPAAQTDGEWSLDEEAMDQLIQEQIARDAGAFLEAALADEEPVKIELDWEDAS